MELILLQRVTNLGDLGEKVKVKPGYGRNYLVPQGKAVPATPANIAEFEARRAEYEAKAQAIPDEAQARLAKIDGSSVASDANACPGGRLYGSVGPRDVAEALTKPGAPVEKSGVVRGEGPLPNTGEYEVTVHLHAAVEASVKII